MSFQALHRDQGGTTIDLTGYNDGTYVLNYTGQNIHIDGEKLFININKGQHLILNCTSSDVNIGTYVINGITTSGLVGNTDKNNDWLTTAVIFNIINDKNVVISNTVGVFIAPKSKVTPGAVNAGVLVCDSVYDSNEWHYHNHDLPSVYGTEVVLEARKTVDGKDAEAGQIFTFELSEWNGQKWSDTTLDSVQNNNGTITFKPIRYGKDSDVGTHYYRITEKVESNSEYTFDTKTYVAKVVVSQNTVNNNDTKYTATEPEYYELSSKDANPTQATTRLNSKPTFNNRKARKATIVKAWEGTKGNKIFAYVCPRAYRYGKGIGNNDLQKEVADKFGIVVELSENNGWTYSFDIPADKYTYNNVTYDLIYRVTELKLYKDNGDQYTKGELENLIKNGSGNVFVYNDGADNSTTVSDGYIVSYSSSIAATCSGDTGNNRIVYKTGQTVDATVTIKNTQLNPYEIYAYKLVDGQPANSGHNFTFTLKMWNGSSWQNLANDLRNGKMRTKNGDSDIDPYKIGYTIYPSDLGMTAGNGNDYYFLLTENSTEGTGYTKDAEKILVKIKHYKDNAPGVTNEVCYYLFKSTDENYTRLDTSSYSGDEAHRKKSTDINDVNNIPVFKNHSTTKVVVKKQWGVDGDTGAKDYAFDVNIVLFRKLEGHDNSQAEQVESKTLTKGSESVEFTDLLRSDDSGTPYEYFVKEYCGDTEFVLNGNVINEFRLKSITPFEVTDGEGFLLTNVPVITLEKEWTKNGTPITKEEGSVTVRLYQGKNGQPAVSLGEYTLSAENNWKQIVEVPRGYNSNIQSYTYYIVELKLDGTENGESALITYIAEDGKSTKTGTNPSKVYARAMNGSVLKLRVVNEIGDNVLPETGGNGVGQFAAIGALLIAIAFAGMMLFRKRRAH
jgi:LPXTG-motif cell wall-anchored protein